MRLKVKAAAATTAAGLLAAACSAGPQPGRQPPTPTSTGRVTAARDGGGRQHVTVRATDAFRFEPATIAAHTGKLRVTLVDVGAYPHDIALRELGAESPTVDAGPGQNTTTFTLTFPRPGTYDFVCSYHSSAGMRGEFVIN